MELSKIIELIESKQKREKKEQLHNLKLFLKGKLENNFEEISNLIDEFANIEINSSNNIEMKQEVKEEEEVIYNEKNNKKINNNETYGISAEVALCQVYNIDRDKSYNGRYNQRIVDKFIPVLEKFKTDNPNIIVTESCGHTGGKVDFKATINSVENQSLSLKTLMSHDGSISPQNIGQKARKAWDIHFKTGFNGEKNKDKERFDFIKANISDYMNQMLDNLYCCDYLITIVNCKKTPQIILSSSKPDIDFNSFQIYYTKENYESLWDEKNLKYNGFSTTVKILYDGKEISIGEIQFHNTRNCIKFRFKFKFINSLN